MIVSVTVHHCHFCGSDDIVKNGTDYKGKQKFKCRDCGSFGSLDPTVKYSDEDKEIILRTYQERASMRGIKRIFGVVYRTLKRWMLEEEEGLPDFADTLVEAQDDDVLELDELWSYVFKKSNKQWVWIALCRRTLQIVAYFIGDRSEASCRKLWEAIPDEYKECYSYSDFWSTYDKIFGIENHASVGKETGQTAHVERWNNTLRQRLARFVRKTLSFSKSELMHELALKLFIYRYNLDRLAMFA